MRRDPSEIIPRDYDEGVYRNEWRWQEGDLTVTRSAQYTAPGCHDSCSLLYYTDADGNLVDVEGDPRSSYNSGRLCMRCLNMLETVNHPERLGHPMKRVGERGEDKWEQITWDEAYDIIVENVHDVWENYGPQSIVGMQGTGRSVVWQVPMLTFMGFGSPNMSGGFLSGDACYLPRIIGCALYGGGLWVVDAAQFHEKRYLDENWTKPELVLVWGNNPVASNADGFYGHWIVDLMRMGTRLITIDPRMTWLAVRSEQWLAIRPGTDAALALAMINVAVEEDLYDHEFVEKWTFGFDELKARAAEYAPEVAAEICYLDTEEIRKAARAFATAKPAAIQWGVSLDQQTHGVQAAAALSHLGAMCGNLDVPGGNVFAISAYNVCDNYSCGQFAVDPELMKKRIGEDSTPLHRGGFAQLAQEDAVLRAIETDEPYPVRMIWMQGTNPIANMGADSPRVYRALKRVPFIVVVDAVKTPTIVACADLVLPCAMSCERNSARAWNWPMRSLVQVTQHEECKSDETIILEVGKRLKPENWPWETDTELITWWIQGGGSPDKPWPQKAGFTWEDLREDVMMWEEEYPYRKYEKGLLRPDGQPGFMTPTGLYEFKSVLFEAWGLDPLPFFCEPPESPVSTPELAREYPYVLTTGMRSFEFFHSEHRNLETMREFHPDPITEISPAVAAANGIEEGDWIWVENMRGRCRQRAHLNPSHPDWLVSSEHGWWFPEREAAEPSLYGVFDSNINNLTPMEQIGPVGLGAPYKCQICRIYKDDGSVPNPTETIIREGGPFNG